MKNKKTLARLKEQQEIIKARIINLEAREKTQERKRDTRRKILIGSYYLEKSRENSSMDEIKKLMDSFLTRNSDRMLFDLVQIENPPKKEIYTEEKKEEFQSA